MISAVQMLAVRNTPLCEVFLCTESVMVMQISFLVDNPSVFIAKEIVMIQINKPLYAMKLLARKRVLVNHKKIIPLKNYTEFLVT